MPRVKHQNIKNVFYKKAELKNWIIQINSNKLRNNSQITFSKKGK